MTQYKDMALFADGKRIATMEEAEFTIEAEDAAPGPGLGAYAGSVTASFKVTLTEEEYRAVFVPVLVADLRAREMELRKQLFWLWHADIMRQFADAVEAQGVEPLPCLWPWREAQ